MYTGGEGIGHNAGFAHEYGTRAAIGVAPFG